MQNDLISRSALIETIEQDIKMTEKFMERVSMPCQEYSCLNAQLNTLKSYKAIVEDKPCAYDVEKVVTELEESLQGAKDSKDLSKYSAYQQAIAIVRNGGKE